MLIKKITEIENPTAFGIVVKQGQFSDAASTSITWYFLGMPFRKDIVRIKEPVQ